MRETLCEFSQRKLAERLNSGNARHGQAKGHTVVVRSTGAPELLRAIAKILRKLSAGPMCDPGSQMGSHLPEPRRSPMIEIRRISDDVNSARQVMVNGRILQCLCGTG